MGFEPTISAGKRPQTYALDSVAIGTGLAFITRRKTHRKTYQISATFKADRVTWILCSTRSRESAVGTETRLRDGRSGFRLLAWSRG